MKRNFKKAVHHELSQTKSITREVLTEQDLIHLPDIIKRYIRLTGFIGKEKIFNFRAEFNGGIRFKPGEEFMPLKSVQYNFTEIPTRLFYIIATRKGIRVTGLHLYRKAEAIFKIKILGLFTVVNAFGPKMDQGETVTIFNDLCFMAPGALTDDRINWEPVDDLTVKAVFTNENITIRAVLYFRENGELINFVSNDRYETNGKEYHNYPWSTPVEAYKEINGYRLPGKAKLIYERPEGEFCYGEFELISMEYNCNELK
jgi:hypothetical protein